MRLSLLFLILLFVITGCNSLEGEPAVGKEQDTNKEIEIEKESNIKEVTEEQKYIDLFNSKKYTELMEQTKSKSNDVEKDFYYLAYAFDLESLIESKVANVEQDGVKVSIYYAQYANIKTNIDKVKNVPEEISVKVNELYSMASENKEYYFAKKENELSKYDVERKRLELEEKMIERTLNPKPVSIGMSKEEVLLDGWGQPKDINKTTTTYGVREQWVYPNFKYLYFEDGILVTIQE